MSEEAVLEKEVSSVGDHLETLMEKLVEPESNKVDEAPPVEENKEDAKASTLDDKKEEENDEGPDFGFESEDEKGEDETEEPEEEEEDPESFADDKAKEAYIKLRQKAKENKDRAKELEKELEAAKKGASPEVELKLQEAEKAAARVRELEERVTELSSQSFEAELKNSSEYRQAVTDPLTHLSETVEQIAEDYEFPAEHLANAIAETRISKQEALMKELKLSPIVAQKVLTMSNRYHEITAKKRSMLENAELKHTELRASQEKEALEKENEFKSSLNDQTSSWIEKVKGSNEHLFEDGTETGKALNKALSQAGKVDLRKETPRNQAYARVAGAVLPTALAENKRLRAELEKYTGEKGSLSLSKTSPSEEKKENEEASTFMEMAAKQFQNS